MEINSFKDLFIIFGVLFSIVLVCGKLVERKHTIQDYFIVLLLLCIGAYQLISYLLYCIPQNEMFLRSELPLVHLKWGNVLESVGFMLFFFHGALHYGYCHSVVSARSPLTKLYFLHFLPGVLYVIVYLLLVFTNAGVQGEDSGELSIGHGRIYFYSIVAASFSTVMYMAWCLKKVVPLLAEYPKNNIIFIGMVFTYLLCTSAALFWPVDTALSLNFTDEMRVLTSVYLITIYATSRKHPEQMVYLNSDIERDKYLKTQLQGLDISTVIARLDFLIGREKIYKEKITLSELAERVNVRQHQLSELLNSYMKTTFANYINDNRVREAERLLGDNPELQIIEIALEVGYNSLSVFYKEFKKRTGISPAEFRREFLQKNAERADS